MIHPRTLVVFVALAGPANAQTDAQVAARLTSALHACENAPENGGTFEQALCYRDELYRQDEQLNKTWTRVLATLPPVRQRSLRRREREWIKDRDKNCLAVRSQYANSTAAYMQNSCLVDASIRRILWLERLEKKPPQER